MIEDQEDNIGKLHYIFQMITCQHVQILGFSCILGHIFQSCIVFDNMHSYG